MSTDTLTHDVFLSHSAKDKAVVRPLAERLWANGLGRLPSELHPSSFRLHPLPGAPINGSLAQFVCINWLPADCEQAYGKLFDDNPSKNVNTS